MKKIYLLVALCYFSLSSSAQSLIYSDTIPIVDIRISPEHAMGGMVGDWIEDLTFIPLKTKKEDLIPRAFDLTVIRDKVGLVSRVDGSNHAFLLFDNEGNQLFKTSKESLGLRAPYNNIRSVEIWDNNFIVDAYEYTIVVDDINLEAVASPAGQAKADDSIKVKNTVWYYDSAFDLHERPTKSALTKDDRILIKYARDSVGPMHDLLQNFSNVFITDGEPRAYVTFPYHYKLFELGEEGIANIVNIVLPMKRTIDTAAIFNFQNKEEYDKYFDSNPDLIKGFNKIIRYKDYILINPISIQFEWLAYNTVTGELINLGNILPDESNDFISFMSSEFTTDGEFLYTLIYPNAIRYAQEKCRKEGYSMRPELQAMAKHDNPIVVRFKLK